MFEHLLEFFLHAKSGVIAGVFLVGTTGALVTATVQNGVTTVTVTQASASPSGSASPSISPSTSPNTAGTASASPSTSPSSSSPSSASANPCAAQAHAMADAVKTVNSAFSQYHTGLDHPRQTAKTDAARKTLEDADTLLKSLRQGAVKAIHATSNCRDDEDQNDEDKESEDHQGPDHHVTVTVVTTTTASPSPTLAVSPAPTAPTFTGDPKSIADQAVAAMKLVFDNAKASLPVPTASSSPRPSRTADGDRKGNNGKGKSGEHGD